MSNDEPRSPTFDGTQADDQAGKVVDVSGARAAGRDDSSPPEESDGEAKRPTEAAQIVP
jgi:hypothetical protein